MEPRGLAFTRCRAASELALSWAAFKVYNEVEAAEEQEGEILILFPDLLTKQYR